MANWSDLKASVAEVIKTNSNQEITGQILQNVLNSIISNVGANATFAGVATPTTNPGTPDGPVCYLASQVGTYSNFNQFTVEPGEIGIFVYKTSWQKQRLRYEISEVNVSKIYPTGGIDGTNKYTLETAIAKIPLSLRNVGLKCSFINEEGNLETWEYQGGSFTSSNSWIQVGAKAILELSTHKIILTLENNTQTISLFAKSGDTVYITLYQPEGEIINYLIRGMKNNALTETLFRGKPDEITKGNFISYVLTKAIDSIQLYATNSIAATTVFVHISTLPNIDLKIAQEHYQNEFQSLKDSIPSANEFAKSKFGKNLYNPDESEIGKMINATGALVDMATTLVTGFIKVDGKNVVSNTATQGGTRNAVYNENKEFIRTFVQPYVYQDGDYYIRYTFRKNVENVQIEYGDTSTEYEPYTDKQDAVNAALETADKRFEQKHDNRLFSNRANNYPYTSVSDNGMYLYFFPDYNLAGTHRTLKGKYKLTTILITDAEKLGNFRNQVYTSLGKGLFKIEREIDFSSDEQYPYIFAASGSFRYFTDIVIEPLNDIAIQEVLKYKTGNDTLAYNVTVLTVCKEFDQTTEGFGITRFNNPVDAHNAVANSGEKNRYIIMVAKGDYTTEIQESFKGSDSESGASTIGIRLNNYEFFESFDSDNPELAIFGWDGTYGFSDTVDWEDENNRDKIRNRAFFQIGGANNFVCGIKGFHLKGKNLRYDIHPETAQTGFNHTWNIENCILEFDGRPILGEQDIAIIGTGMGKGTIGNVIHCEFRGLSNSAIGGHDNPKSSAQIMFAQGAKLNLIDCLFNGKRISMTSLYNDGDTPDALLIKNCGKIESVNLGDTWKMTNINSDIANV